MSNILLVHDPSKGSCDQNFGRNSVVENPCSREMWIYIPPRGAAAQRGPWPPHS